MAVSNGNSTARIANLEKTLLTQRDEIVSLREVVETQGRDIRRAVNKINQQLANQGKAKWGLYLTALSVGLAFMIAAGGATLAPLYLMTSSNTAAIEDKTKTLIDRYDGRLKMVEDVIEHDIKALDVTIQREMRLLNDVQDKDKTYLSEQLGIIRDETGKLRDKIQAHELLDGHPATQTSLRVLESQLKKLMDDSDKSK